VACTRRSRQRRRDGWRSGSSGTNTPKHGSWLNIAEIELAALSKQCLRGGSERRELERQVAAWEDARNEAQVEARWQFTTAKARVKLHRLYPSLQ